MGEQRPVNPKPPANCAECGYRVECGGLEGEAALRGCFQRCVTHCQFNWCDMVCPCLHLSFADLIEDVGGLCLPPEHTLRPCLVGELPYYIAQINHGSSRDSVLRESVVAVPLRALVRKNVRGRYIARYESPAGMRDALGLSRSTQVIVSSVAPDQCLEDFWAEHVKQGILPQLAALDLLGMTVPNYSFMLDVPRINSLYNLTRIFRLSERMSEAGIPTILHLQASTVHDWVRWADVLAEQPESNCVALEFQTGAQRPEIGNRYYAGLVRLQEKLNRPLHPLVIAGAGRIAELAAHFQSFSVVDSTPFLKTMNRQTLVRLRDQRLRWRTRYTKPHQSLSELLATNIQRHRERLLRKADLAANSPGELRLSPAA